IEPSHRQHVQGQIRAVGLRWQSLLVMPERQAWMHEPPVPDDAKYRWWKRLRQVPSSWVWNQGEADRFVFYDGPTNAPTPVTVTRRDQTLVFTKGYPPTDSDGAGRTDWLVSLP